MCKRRGGATDQCFDLNNGAALELDHLRIKKELTWEMFANLILRLSSGNVKLNADSARYYIGLLKKTHAKKLQTPLTKRGTGISDFLSSRFEIMSSSSSSSSNLECSGHEEVLNSSTSEIEELLFNSLQLEESRLNVSNLSRSLYTKKQMCKETKMEFKKINNKLSRVQKKNELLSDVQRINLSLSKEIKEVRKENEITSLALIKKNKKLSKLNARNINKRLKARDDTIKKLQAKISSKDKELSDQKKKKNLSLSKRLKQMSAKETSLRTKVWYWKRAARNKISKTSTTSFEEKLGVDVLYLENEVVKRQEKLENKSNEKNLDFYENGKYNDDIRMVYEDLLSMGLSSRNVENCVRLVLEKLAKVKVGRLPKVTFTKNMFLEARRLAQIHVASVLSENQGNLTLHSDGTSKHGRSYTT